jgi:Mesyanzhinovviridae Dda-like helicase
VIAAAAADKRLTRADLSPDQRRVYEAMLDWSKNPSGVLTVAGFAGTGKSTLLGLFAADTASLRVAYICFTGRASSVLGRKLHAAGIQTTNLSQADDERRLTGRWGHLFYGPFDPEARLPFCGTIHRLLYRAVIDNVSEELLGWTKREKLDRSYDIIVCDESSMIDADIVSDILQHGVPVLAVGDHGQLPPVRGKGSLMANPRLRLEKIHRQAEGSPIIQLSRIIREEGRLDRSLADGRQLVFGSGRDLRRTLVDVAGKPALDVAFLCWRNQTREHINRSAREYKGYAGLPPQAGEPVICLRNYPPVYNGMRGVMVETASYPYADEWWLMRARVAFPDEGVEATDYEVCRDQFYRHETFKSIDELKAKGIKVYSMGEAGKLMDFGYALTVHKSQGSSFEHAVVMADWRPNYQEEMVRRLAYSAVTRASHRLTVLT